MTTIGVSKKRKGGFFSTKSFVLVTIISTVLGFISAIATNYPLSLTHWQDLVRDTLFFSMLSAILLGFIDVLLEFEKTDMFAILRTVYDNEGSKMLFEIIKNSDKVSKEYPFFGNLITAKLKDLAENLESLGSGEYKFSKSEINQRTGELYSEVKRNIRAVSFIDPRMYWGSREFGPAAMEANRKVCDRGVKVERIFLFHRPEEIVNGIKILTTLQESGTILFYTLIKDLEKNLQADFSIYDGKYVQYFEFEESTFNKEYKDCIVSLKPAVVKQFEQIYEELIRRGAKPMKPLLDKNHGVPILGGKSLWEYPEIYEHYSGSTPNLHLEKLETSPRTVLDIGCGAGRTLELFAKLGCELVGIEENPRAIELCQKRYCNSNIRLINDRFHDGSLNDAKFDVVVAYNSIYHSKKDEFFAAIKQISKILNPGGYLLLTIKTVNGNEAVFEGATEIEQNTWIGCNFPDYETVHHFCTYEEITEIESLFYKTVYKEPIPLIRSNGMIVQGQGFYMILKKAPTAV
jgi:SAM-dependent methyltransferase